MYLKERDQLSYHGSHHSGIGSGLSIESKGTRTPVHDDDVVVSLLQELAGHLLKHARMSCDTYVMHNIKHLPCHTDLSLLLQHNTGYTHLRHATCTSCTTSHIYHGTWTYPCCFRIILGTRTYGMRQRHTFTMAHGFISVSSA